MKRGILLALACVVATFAQADLLYTVQEGTDSLATINTTSGAVNVIGSLGTSYNFGDLAFNTNNNTMYMVNGRGSVPSNLYTVNLTTGQATLIGSTGQVEMFGLAFDPTTGKLFGSQSTGATGFFDMNLGTGSATLIGNPGVNLDGMTYVGSTGDIAGMWAGPGSLHRINRNTGAQTLLSAGGGFVDNGGLAWLASDNNIYSVDWSGGFYKYNVGSAYARTTIITGIGSYDGLASAAPVPEPMTIAMLGAGLVALAKRRRK